MVRELDGVVLEHTSETQMKPTDGISADGNNLMGGVQTRSGNAQQMAQSGALLKYESKPRSSLNTGWKWAQCEDAEWMLDDFVRNVNGTTVWGIPKEELWEK